jgi:predicted ArsR family transcriptional regulator
VRQQLLQLQRDGWVESKAQRGAERARTGRPATLYSLSEAGDHLFPKHYDALTVAMLDAVSENFGNEALLRVLARLADERVATVGPSMRGLPLEEKVLSLKNWYLEGDPYMGAETTGASYVLKERNCPFLNAALVRPMICSVTVNAMTRVLGYQVVREERFQNGDGRCVFRVMKDQPIDPENYPFELEPRVVTR